MVRTWDKTLGSLSVKRAGLPPEELDTSQLTYKELRFELRELGNRLECNLVGVMAGSEPKEN